MTIEKYLSNFDNQVIFKKGGQKKVYKVYKGENIFAFKIIHESGDERVLQEIKILKEMKIEGIPKIIETGMLKDNDGDDVLFILEEFVGETSIRDRINQKKFLSLNEAFELLSCLLKIEIKLEELGIIHRDIKPDNIVINSNNSFHLIDFGVAKILGANSITMAGSSYAPHTPGYAPSEQIMNDRMLINSKLDLFQIGVTIYESITGVNPFSDKAKDIGEVYHNTVAKYPEPLNIPGDSLGYFSEFVLMLMSKKQSQRPENASRAMEYLSAIQSTLELEEIR